MANKQHKKIVWKQIRKNDFKNSYVEVIVGNPLQFNKRFDLRSTCKLVIAYFYLTSNVM